MTVTLLPGRTCARLLGLLALPVATAVPLAAQAPTFNADVAPIVYQSCAVCHRSGEIGPMPLTTYAEVHARAEAIRDVVASRAMPPWFAVPGVRHFANDPSLSDEEIATIVAWVDAGAPEGDQGIEPHLPEFTEGWRMGEPDVVYAPGSFDTPGEARSEYANLPIVTGFDRDMYVTDAEVRVGLPEYTHHANLLADVESGQYRVAGYSPGGMASSYPPGVAKLIPAGTDLRLNIHYNPKGEPRSDPGTIVGLRLADGPVRQIVYTDQSGNGDVDIPPGAPDHEMLGRPFVFEEDSHILSLRPRMNERGKDFEYTLVLPDGTSDKLLRVEGWDNGWVLNYVLEEPVAAPKGSRLETIAHYDNSAANPRNPDPTARVRFGPEIMSGYFEYTLDHQDLTHVAQDQ